MVNVIGVRFRQAGKVYYFSPGEAVFQRGDHVIVETARGVEYGEVILGNHEVDEIKVVQPLRPIIRPANEEDTRHEEENREKQKEAFQICREKIRRHQLDMKLIDCEFTFDNSKILFYFTADGRIDFRELVKDLASVFRTRIELRQVGVRDETKLLGGLGSCGRPLCCHSYLNDFVPVSIKMAKEQNLSLNPTKISGVCGRLMCCLKNEEEVYEELNRKLPSAGDYVATADGLSGEVQSVSILKQQVKVIVNLPNDEKEVREYPAEELTVNGRRPRGGRGRQQNQPGSGFARGKASAVQETTENSIKDGPREDAAEAERTGEIQERGRERRRSGRGERMDRPVRPEKSSRGERSRRGDRMERGEWTERADTRERREKPESQERQERGRRLERGGRNERNEKTAARSGRERYRMQAARTPGEADAGQAQGTGKPEIFSEAKGQREGRERSERQRERRRGRGSERRGEIQVIPDMPSGAPRQES